MNISDGFPGGLELGEACRNAKYFEEAGADALVLSGGFVSLSGFFMLRGKVPLWDMAKVHIFNGVICSYSAFFVCIQKQAMVRNSWTKGIAVLLFGKWLVPEIALEPCFFRAGARAILSSVRAVPVCVLGGINGLGAIEGAMKEGFAMVQMARALIREPFFVKRLIREIESSEELGGGQRKGSGGEDDAGDGEELRPVSVTLWKELEDDMRRRQQEGADGETMKPVEKAAALLVEVRG